jgi:hypothetical protein
VYVAKTPREKAMQRALLQFDQRRNWPLIREALREAGREDLIGPGGLVPDDSQTGERRRGGPKGKSRKDSKTKDAAKPKIAKAGRQAGGKTGAAPRAGGAKHGKGGAKRAGR